MNRRLMVTINRMANLVIGKVRLNSMLDYEAYQNKVRRRIAVVRLVPQT